MRRRTSGSPSRWLGQSPAELLTLGPTSIQRDKVRPEICKHVKSPGLGSGHEIDMRAVDPGADVICSDAAVVDEAARGIRARHDFSIQLFHIQPRAKSNARSVHRDGTEWNERVIRGAYPPRRA